MPYIKKVKKVKRHLCKTPQYRYGNGSMWRCRKCKAVWELVKNYWTRVQPCGKGICARNDGHEGECCF